MRRLDSACMTCCELTVSEAQLHTNRNERISAACSLSAARIQQNSGPEPQLVTTLGPASKLLADSFKLWMITALTETLLSSLTLPFVSVKCDSSSWLHDISLPVGSHLSCVICRVVFGMRQRRVSPQTSMTLGLTVKLELADVRNRKSAPQLTSSPSSL